MSDTGRLYQFFSHLFHTIAKEDGEGSGESTFAAFVEKIMQKKRALEASSSTIEEQTSQGKRLGPCVQSQSEQRGKVRVSVSTAVTDKWRDAIFSVKFLYHELGNYFIENKR